MHKTYTTRDLWGLMRKVYYGAIHWRWDAANSYYLNDDGKPNGPVNCHFDEGSTHSPVYQNGHVGFWLMGHRMFEPAGVKEYPWMDFLRKTMRVCLLNNMASNGLDPYVIEPYPLVERYQPASQIYLGSLAAWAASCPQALRSPDLAGLARFLCDCVVQTYEGIMDPEEGLPREFYHLSEYRDPATGNYQRKLACNYCFLDNVAHIASFAAPDSAEPQRRGTGRNLAGWVELPGTLPGGGSRPACGPGLSVEDSGRRR